MRKALMTTLFILLGTPSLFIAQTLNNTQAEQFQGSFVGYIPDAIVVKFDSTLYRQFDLQSALENGLTGVASVDRLASLYGVRSLEQRFPGAKVKWVRGRLLDMKGWFKVYFSEEVVVDQVVQAYKNIPGVVDAQPIGIHRVEKIPNDPRFSEQWHLNQSQDHDIDAPEAWDLQTGNSSIIVAILDTGVRYFHKDLGGTNASFTNPENARGNMWINWVEKNGTPGVDDDGNGYVDDWIGWDFVDGVNAMTGEDGSTPDNDPRDFNGHGTHCSGIVAAMNNNGYGVSSPAGGWGNGTNTEDGNGVKIMALRIGWSELFLGLIEMGYVSMDFAASAFYYAANNGARIASCSWGSSNDGGLGDAVDYFLYENNEQVRLVFKAAGNDNDEVSDFLNDHAGVISVASTDSNDVKSDFSSYGVWVEISAPGSDILSTYHDHNNEQDDAFAFLSGTSMATPLAAGVAAQIWSANPSLTALEVKQILYDNADDIYSISGNSSYQGKLGVGRVNAYSSLNDPSLPVSLVSFTARAERNQVFLQWETASEINNAGFEVYRAENSPQNYRRIASYTEFKELVGQGSTNRTTYYSFKDRTVLPNRIYFYKIADVSYSGERTFSSAIRVQTLGNGIATEENGEIPRQFQLFAPYPNPFNPATKIKFAVPRLTANQVDQINLIIYDNLGRKIKKLFAGNLAPGIYQTQWDGTNDNGKRVSSGIYFVVFQSNVDRLVQKVMFVR